MKPSTLAGALALLALLLLASPGVRVVRTAPPAATPPAASLTGPAARP